MKDKHILYMNAENELTIRVTHDGWITLWSNVGKIKEDKTKSKNGGKEENTGSFIPFVTTKKREIRHRQNHIITKLKLEKIKLSFMLHHINLIILMR